MTNRERFLAGHHFTLKNDWGEFDYFFDTQGHSEGGWIFHYKGKNVSARQMGSATYNDDHFIFVLRGLLVDHKEEISFDQLTFGYNDLVKGELSKSWR